MPKKKSKQSQKEYKSVRDVRDRDRYVGNLFDGRARNDIEDGRKMRRQGVINGDGIVEGTKER